MASSNIDDKLAALRKRGEKAAAAAKNSSSRSLFGRRKFVPCRMPC